MFDILRAHLPWHACSATVSSLRPRSARLTDCLSGHRACAQHAPSSAKATGSRAARHVPCCRESRIHRAPRSRRAVPFPPTTWSGAAPFSGPRRLPRGFAGMNCKDWAAPRVGLRSIAERVASLRVQLTGSGLLAPTCAGIGLRNPQPAAGASGRPPRLHMAALRVAASCRVAAGVRRRVAVEVRRLLRRPPNSTIRPPYTARSIRQHRANHAACSRRMRACRVRAVRR